MIFYFEYRNDNYDKLKKFEIVNNPDNDRFILEAIEPPCNDRKIIATGDSITELVEWTLNNYNEKR